MTFHGRCLTQSSHGMWPCSISVAASLLRSVDHSGDPCIWTLIWQLDSKSFFGLLPDTLSLWRWRQSSPRWNPSSHFFWPQSMFQSSDASSARMPSMRRSLASGAMAAFLAASLARWCSVAFCDFKRPQQSFWPVSCFFYHSIAFCCQAAFLALFNFLTRFPVFLAPTMPCTAWQNVSMSFYVCGCRYPQLPHQ